jgi:hypothetical protein
MGFTGSLMAACGFFFSRRKRWISVRLSCALPLAG